MKKLGILLIAGVLLVGNSCQKYLEGINENPNNATDASLENLMTSAMVSFLGYNEGEDARMVGMWSQQFTGSDRQYSGYDAYIVSTGNFDFFQPYIGVIQTADLAIVKSDELGNKVATGAMKILKGATFGYVASMYGDAPFSEAVNFEEFPTPAYDAQDAVYTGAISLLNEGIADINTGKGGLPVDIFGMSEAEWTAAARSYIARIELHRGNYAAARSAADNGVARGGDMMGTHGTAKEGDRNMWYDFVVDERSGYLTAIGAYAPRILDPASPDYVTDAKTDEGARFNFIYAGAYPDYEVNTNVSGAVSDTEVMFGMTSSYPMITFAETQLIIAETAFRAGDVTPALTALNAVRAELREDKFPTGQYDDYVAADLPGNALFDAIILEKYKSLIGQTEAFNDMNRLGNPLGLTPKGGASALPQRFFYPQGEVNSNPNVPDPLPGLFDVLPANK